MGMKLVGITIKLVGMKLVGMKLVCIKVVGINLVGIKFLGMKLVGIKYDHRYSASAPAHLHVYIDILLKIRYSEEYAKKIFFAQVHFVFVTILPPIKVILCPCHELGL